MFADKCHHGKEEDLYFPNLKEIVDSDHDTANVQLMEQLLQEHGEGRKYLPQMSQSMESQFIAGDFISAANSYIQLLRQHIKREDDILFPWGDDKISTDKNAQLLESFEKFEEEVMGAGTHERLHDLLHHFAHKYLNKTH